MVLAPFRREELWPDQFQGAETNRKKSFSTLVRPTHVHAFLLVEGVKL